ncbi:hypothetical protein N2605_26730 [Bradyrhizobium yuanmingense]|uniref:hypothetical protein n=1 Tax=Bradyrhizobium yuanmingense TaxID=108015 RepID=UPI0021A91E02|nr:hypothetical protein [Bradyrhizobium sp. CB1024]UWU83127.1 hypothetical protein N2605_26730 [Bradyrhizobium sp. CB1024]
MGSCIRGHCRIGISCTDILVFAALPTLSPFVAFIVALIFAQYIHRMLLGEAVPTHIGADQRSSTGTTSAVAILAFRQASTVRLKIITESIFAPAMADARQAGMVP